MTNNNLAHHFSRLLLIFFIIVTFFVVAQPTHAVYFFANLSDRVNTTVPNAPSEHVLSFTLPSNSAPIDHTDYIQINYADFEDVTAPSYMTGYFAGSPMYSVSGKTARVTNITVQPGQYVSIQGINTTNAPTEEQFQVIVMVTEDEDGLIVKNKGNVMATKNWGSVTVTASIEPELGNLQISGYAAPYTFIIFTRGSSVIGTDVASPTGYFSQVFSGLQPTTHTVTFYGIDQNNRATSPISVEIYTPAHQQTTISNQLLSPTIEIFDNQFLQGDSIIASGSALPSSEVALLTDNPLRSYYTNSNSDGLWSYAITNTDQYIIGDYHIYNLVHNGSGLQSLFSNSINFSIISDISGGTACGDISTGDLNCDAQINLTDFSILMYYWGSANAAADINLDDKVNLTDFSIMMYYWGT